MARLAVPAAYGGLWDGTERGGWGAVIRAVREISAGDGPTGQNWLTTALVARELFGPDSGLPEPTRAELARRLLDDGLRLVSSAAETGVSGRTTARPVAGGVVLSGTKSFNTNSGGLGVAAVRCVLAGEPPTPHQVLVDLTHPQVRLHDDWDTMGQRGTRSQTVTYQDVFVPDGRHQPSPGRSPRSSWARRCCCTPACCRASAKAPWTPSSSTRAPWNAARCPSSPPRPRIR